MTSLGKLLIFFGVLLVLIGLIFIVAPKIPFLGRLPGDIYIKKERFTFYFPLATSVLLSVILSLVFWFFRQK